PTVPGCESSILCLCLSVPPRALHPFPTRRSSDLEAGDAWAPGTSPRLTRLRSTGLELAGRVTLSYDFPLSVRLGVAQPLAAPRRDRKSTRLNSSHQIISYAVFCLKKKRTGSTRRT